QLETARDPAEAAPVAGSPLLRQTELPNDAGDQQPTANHPYQVDRHISCLVFTVHQRVSPSTPPESAAFASTPDVTDPALAETMALDQEVSKQPCCLLGPFAAYLGTAAKL